MNQFTNLFSKAISEVDEWVRNSEDASKYPSEFFTGIKKSLADARDSDSPEQVDMLVRLIAYSITDSGPLGKGFIPAFDQVYLAIYERDKRAGRA